MSTVQQQTAADTTTAPDPAPLALPAPQATRQQVFWQIILQSLIYGAAGGFFCLLVLVIQNLPYTGLFSSVGSGFIIILALIAATVSGGGVGLVLGLIGALLTICVYPMRSPRVYQAAMWVLPLAASMIVIKWFFPTGLSGVSFSFQCLLITSTLSMLWATQRVTTSAIRRVGVVNLPYYRPAPRLFDLYRSESRSALFDMAPEIYDRMERLAGLGMLARWRGALLARLDLRPGMRAVDLMAGTGAMSRALVRRVGAGNVTAVELAPSVAARLRGVDGVAVVEADALASGLPSGGADVVTCVFGTLGMREHDHVCLADAVDRLLAPNGVVGMVDMTTPPNWLLRRAYMAYLRRGVPAVARLFLDRPALYDELHRYMRASVGLGPLVQALEGRGYTVSLAPLDGGMATALVAMKKGVEE